ncbi:hypothetical protein TcG_06631 [Trypanosoma cruzi]|nr:hypothetical protein TcG_06631 [Trypanosoma cruzi]
MNGAVNGLVPFFLAGHKMCVLLSHKDSGTLTGDSLESPMRLRNEMHYGGSLFVARSEVILCRRRVLLSSNSLECPAMLRFKGERKCGWHRESVRALELKEKNMIELDEKQCRRITEVKIEQTNCGSQCDAHSSRTHVFLVGGQSRGQHLFFCLAFFLVAVVFFSSFFSLLLLFRG